MVPTFAFATNAWALGSAETGAQLSTPLAGGDGSYAGPAPRRPKIHHDDFIFHALGQLALQLERGEVREGVSRFQPAKGGLTQDGAKSGGQ